MIPHSKPTISRDEIKSVKDVLLSKYLSCGRKTEDFEEKFARYIGVKYAIAVNSGTSALHLSLLSLGIGSNDEVIIPNYVCTAVLHSVLYVGAKPVLCDVSISDYNIDIEEVKKKITKNTKAIIVVHLFGYPANVLEFMSLGIPIVEDVAQSPGAEIGGKKVGSFGKINIFSFYSTKFITTGEGGMLTTNDRKLYCKVLDMRSYDERKNYRLRYNYKITDVASSLGISQLKKIEMFIKKRKYIASIYNNEFKNLPVVLPPQDKDKRAVYYRYCIRLQNRDKIQKEIIKEGVEVKKPVFKPLNRYLGIPGFKNSDKIDKEILSLPIYPSLKRDEIRKIVKVVQSKIS